MAPEAAERPAHLALFVRSLAGGGAERSLVALAGGLAERGHRVDLVVGRRRGAFADAVPASVRCVDLGGPRWARTALGALRAPDLAAALLPSLASGSPPGVVGCAPALADYLRRERPDALFSALVYANLTAIWARRLAGTGVRLVVSERNAIAARVATDPRRRIQRLPQLIRRFYPEADRVATVSEGVAGEVRALTGLDADRVRATYNPIRVPEAAASPPHPWLAPGEPSVVLGAGKLKPQKDLATLLRAFARVRSERPLRLVLLGEGPERGALEALARELGVAEDVALPGFASDPFAWMRGAAVFALSSRFEGLPGVLLQALACGCPAVSTDCDHGPREILQDGRLGPLVPVGDAEALAAALRRQLDAPPDRQALRDRARAFDVASCVDRTLALLLGQAPGTSSASSAAQRSATASTV